MANQNNTGKPKLARDPFQTGQAQDDNDTGAQPPQVDQDDPEPPAPRSAPPKKKAAKRKRRKLTAKPKKTTRRRMTDPIVITGISGNLGRLITKTLHTEHSIIGIDQRKFKNKPKDVIHHQIDARRTKAEDIFRSNPIRALIHLGLVHRIRPTGRNFREWNTLGTIKLLDYCQRYGVRKVVLLSTAQVYGALPTNSNFLTEDAPLVGQPGYPEMQALIEWDMYAQSFFWKHPDIETVILRPVHVVGPSVRNIASNYLRLKRPFTLMGFDPMVQLVHEQDLIQAILLALEPGRRGVYNIVGPGEVPLSRALSELGRDPIGIPHPLADLALKKLWRYGLSGFPPGELPHLRYQCLVDGTRAKEMLGYRPRFTLRETVRSVLA